METFKEKTITTTNQQNDEDTINAITAMTTTTTTTTTTKETSGIDEDEAIVLFTSSLVKKTASHLRLPANYVGVRCARQDFKRAVSAKGNDVRDEEKIARHKASNDVKFCVVDENGNERRMTKAEKKAKKLQLARAKKEAKKEAISKKKRKLDETAFDDRKKIDSEPKNEADDEANEYGEVNSNRNMATATTAAKVTTSAVVAAAAEAAAASTAYHQLPLNPTTIEQELAEFKGKRGNAPPQILSPPMALQFLSKVGKLTRTRTEDAILTYDHNLSREWANRLKEQCVLPAEAARQKEDLRPLAYRLQPEPWQRLRPTLEENPLSTTSRNRNDGDGNGESLSSSSSAVSNDASGSKVVNDDPKPCDWVPLTCRPRLVGLEKTKGIKHDDILSIVFEYIHRETPFHISCGSKFGSDFLVYDGPREERHAFAGLRVLSRFTNSMTATPALALTSTSSTPMPPQSSSENDPDNAKKDSSTDCGAQLPLPTAYSLTGFVRCLNTAGKLALLATVDEVRACDNGDEEKISPGSVGTKKTKYRVAFVDVALEKVLDVHKRKNRGRADKKKLQKRRDVTRTLSKR